MYARQMTAEIVITLLYGVAIAIGGIVGFVQAKSLPSLISGGALGLLVVLGAIFWQGGSRPGYWLAASATVLVTLFFGRQLVRALKTGKPFGRAAGILSLSIVELVVLFFF